MASKQAVTLVTGATGFVGSHVVDRLLEGGRTVRCLVRRESNLRYLKDSRLQFAYGGLDDATDWDAALADVETVYHVAGLTFARRERARRGARLFHFERRGLFDAAARHPHRRDDGPPRPATGDSAPPGLRRRAGCRRRGGADAQAAGDQS